MATKRSPASARAASPRPAARPATSAHAVSPAGQWQLLSPNPDKAWAEVFFLKYSLLWPALFGAWAKSGWHLLVSDVGNTLVTLLIFAPAFVGPLLWCPTQRQPTDCYWFKFLVWMSVFSFVATYFFTEYFFDVLGMKYIFPHLSWNLDSIAVGKGHLRVPIMMYAHGTYFFLTYHTCSIIVMRVARTSPWARQLPFALGDAFATFAAAFFFAAGEIFFTTMDAIKDQFAYKDMDWALTWGALAYSTYFIASFPMVQWLDEDEKKRWSIYKVLENSLAASMLAFIILDVVCQFVIPPYWRDKNWWAEELGKH